MFLEIILSHLLAANIRRLHDTFLKDHFIVVVNISHNQLNDAFVRFDAKGTEHNEKGQFGFDTG